MTTDASKIRLVNAHTLSGVSALSLLFLYGLWIGEYSWIVGLVPLILCLLAAFFAIGLYQSGKKLDFQVMEHEILDSLSDLLYLIDSKNLILWSNTTLSKELGWSPAELQNMPLDSSVHPDDLQQFRSALQDVRARALGRTQKQIRLRHLDGRWIPFEVVFRNLQDRSQIRGIVISAKNLSSVENLRQTLDEKSDRIHRLENDLVRSESFALRILDTVPDPIFVKDRNHNWIKVNDAFCKMMGRSREELLGHSDRDFFESEEIEVFWEMDERTFREQRTTENEEWITLERGMRRRIRTKKCVLLEPGNDPLLIGVIRDITEMLRTRTALEEARAQAEAIAKQKGEFLATLSHEVRNPLQAMLGATELLLGEPLTPSAREIIRLMSRSETHLLQIVDDILELARLEAGITVLREENFSPLDLGKETAELFAPLAQTRGGTIQCICDPDLPQLKGDPARIRQILSNLTSNAVRHAGDSSIEIIFRRLEQHGDRVKLQIEVRDQGPGFPAEIARQLFDRWQRGNGTQNGSGLGLSIVQHLASVMGGGVDADSQLGAGARFRVWLWLRTAEDHIPKIDPPKIETVPAIEIPHNQSSLTGLVAESVTSEGGTTSLTAGLRVLAAEDNRTNQMVLLRQLQRLGCEPTLVCDGAQAVKAFISGTWDVVLMDCQMPVMDGFEAVRQIRKHELDTQQKPTPILAVTALTLQAERQECLACGMNDVITKPVRSHELGAALGRYARP